MNLAVVLVSEQTVPNILFLKDFENEWDKVLLISTEQMEKKGKPKSKSQIIAEFFENKPKEDFLVEIVPPDNAQEIFNTLNNHFQNNSYDTILANITGGNKLMSLVTFDFFKNQQNARVYYYPIGGPSYLHILPSFATNTIPTAYKLTVESYFKATGNTLSPKPIPNETLLTKLSELLFEKYHDNYQTILNITEKLRQYRDSKKEKERKQFAQSNAFEILKKELSTLGIDENHIAELNPLKKDFYDFFSGGWFEIYTYNKIKNAQNKPEDVLINIRLNQQTSKKLDEPKDNTKAQPNELDVAFTKNNRLHIVECKTGDVVEQLNDIVYKVGYLRREFGLDVNSHLLVLNPPDKPIKEATKNRAAYYNIDLWDFDKITKEGIESIVK